MAQQAISLLRDSDRLSKYSRNALEFSRQFSWDNTADLFEKVLNSQSEADADPVIS
jgi:glycosyltransferase involved in cell wall biosynthesis